PLNFSRHPTADEFLVPFTWLAAHGADCMVGIDIFPIPSRRGRPAIERDEASLMDVKRAAFVILVQCVLRGEGLGGIAQTGKRMGLQVRVEAREVGG
ncbi:MAG: hypothetical protein Q9170_008257, partial [Blastenia crenularia]